MGKPLSEVPLNIAVAQVVHHGDKITLPEGMELEEGIETLKRRLVYMEEDTKFAEVFSFFPYDGANALNEVLTARFGWSMAEPTPGMFGPEPPAIINIEVAPGEFKKVPWGRFSVPGTEGGYIECGAAWDGSTVCFAISGVIKRKYEDAVTAIFDDVRAYLAASSIYRGKAIKISFNDEHGRAREMPIPEFMDLSDVDEDMLIYSDEVQRQININLLTPISRVHDLIREGIAIKRGTMLAGKYGTGKTLGAKVAAKKAVAVGSTFIYITHADELAKAVEFAKQYQSPSCIVFCEDIDRALKGERTQAMDDILNIIDGIDTKTCNIVTILTTNHIEDINPTMLRPGRLDAIIEIKAPDAKAVQKLLRAYGGANIDPSLDLTRVAQILDGYIPAVIAEVIKRAKLAELSMTPPGTPMRTLSEEALLMAADSIKAHVELLERRSNEESPAIPALEQQLYKVVEAVLLRNPSWMMRNTINIIQE